MAHARPGDPALDKNVVQRFEAIHDALATAVSEVLDDEHVLRNLGQDTLDALDMLNRRIRIECDRGLLPLARYRTVRMRQGVFSRLAKMEMKIERAGLSVPLSDPISEPEAESVEEPQEAENTEQHAQESESEESDEGEGVEMPPAAVAE